MPETARRNRFRVERGLKPPPPKGAGRPAKYPWEDMEPGDSFLIEGEGLTAKDCTSVYNSAKYFGLTVRLRSVEGGVRVWLVARDAETEAEAGSAS